MLNIQYELVNNSGFPPKTEVLYSVLAAQYGKMLAARTPKGICALQFIVNSEDCHIKSLHNVWKGSSINRDDKAFSDVKDVFNGNTAINLHVVGTAFQIKVWQAILAVPKGEVITYKELSEKIGCTNSCRAVGNALGKNPIHYLVPCHRVIKSDGSLGDYAGGIDKKELLLALERKKPLPY